MTLNVSHMVDDPLGKWPIQYIDGCLDIITINKYLLSFAKKILMSIIPPLFVASVEDEIFPFLDLNNLVITSNVILKTKFGYYIDENGDQNLI